MSSRAATSGRHSTVGTAYHRTLVGVTHPVVRLAATVLFAAAGVLAASVGGLLLVVGAARAFGDDVTLDLSDGVGALEMLALNLGLAALVLIAAALVRLVYGTRPRWLSSRRPGLRWRWLAVSAGAAGVVWAPLLLLVTAAATAQRSGRVGVGVGAFIAVVVLTTPLQAAGEEYVFRGLLLQGLGAARLPTWLCCGVSAAAFAAAHLQFAAPLLADRFLLGCVLAALAVRTGGLEAGIAIHAVKNIAVLVPAGLLEQTDAALDPTGITWIPLVVDAVLLALVTPWLLALSRRRQVTA